MRAQDVGLARPTIFVCHEKSVKNLSRTDTMLSHTQIHYKTGAQSLPKKIVKSTVSRIAATIPRKQPVRLSRSYILSGIS